MGRDFWWIEKITILVSITPLPVKPNAQIQILLLQLDPLHILSALQLIPPSIR